MRSTRVLLLKRKVHALVQALPKLSPDTVVAVLRDLVRGSLEDVGELITEVTTFLTLSPSASIGSWVNEMSKVRDCACPPIRATRPSRAVPLMLRVRSRALRSCTAGAACAEGRGRRRRLRTSAARARPTRHGARGATTGLRVCSSGVAHERRAVRSASSASRAAITPGTTVRRVAAIPSKAATRSRGARSTHDSHGRRVLRLRRPRGVEPERVRARSPGAPVAH